MTVSTMVDRTQVYIASTGTGALTLGNAVMGFQGTEALIDGAQYSYSILTGRAAYEFGQGVYNAALGTLTRTPEGSSDGGAPISIPTNAQVAFTALSSDFTSISNSAQQAEQAAQNAAQSALEADQAARDAREAVTTLAETYASEDGASNIGTTSGQTVQEALNAVVAVPFTIPCLVNPPLLDGEMLFTYVFTQRIVFPPDFDGSSGVAIALPAAATTLTILKLPVGEDIADAVPAGEVVYNTDGSFVFTTVDNAPLSFATGEAIITQGQATADATAAYSLTLIGAR